MSSRYIAVYLDAAQVRALREGAQETVLAADEDLEFAQKLQDVNARRRASEIISAKRDLYLEIVGKLQEAAERLNASEGDYTPAELVEVGVWAEEQR